MIGHWVLKNTCTCIGIVVVGNNIDKLVWFYTFGVDSSKSEICKIIPFAD